nr:hypothetical protein [Kibdelosporangium sp. MJ126-NF4]CTQ89435.1 hypothetical protein [Kibdelosporangium sp. MJ126-NF4]
MEKLDRPATPARLTPKPLAHHHNHPPPRSQPKINGESRSRAPKAAFVAAPATPSKR